MWSIDPHIRRESTTARLATEQHGLVTRRQLLGAGHSVNTIDRAVKAGRLIAVHRGVYAVGHVPPSPHARAMAAVLACGPKAVLSHRSAAKLWGLVRYDGPPEVTAPCKRGRPGIRAHRATLGEAEITAHYGIPVTTPARTLADLSRAVSPATLDRAVNEACVRRLVAADDLPPKLRPAHAPTRSAFEDAFLTFLDRHGLPRPEVNAIVAGYEVDMLWRSRRLIAELDGHRYHADRFEQDRERDADLLAAGLRVVRVTWDRLHRREAQEAQRFRQLLA